MPIAHILMLEGRSEEQKAAVIAKVTEALVEAVGVPRETVRVLIQDLPKSNWGIGGQSVKALGR